MVKLQLLFEKFGISTSLNAFIKLNSHSVMQRSENFFQKSKKIKKRSFAVSIQFWQRGKSLSELGFDKIAFLSCGAYGDVFNGICYDKASKLYEINNNEDLNDSQNIWSIDGKLNKEKSLEDKAIAVKVIKIVNLRNMRYLNEAKIMQGLNHPNIVEI